MSAEKPLHQDINKYKTAFLIQTNIKFCGAVNWLVQKSHCILDMWHILRNQCKSKTKTSVVNKMNTQLDCTFIVVVVMERTADWSNAKTLCVNFFFFAKHCWEIMCTVYMSLSTESTQGEESTDKSNQTSASTVELKCKLFPTNVSWSASHIHQIQWLCWNNQ